MWESHGASDEDWCDIAPELLSLEICKGEKRNQPATKKFANDINDIFSIAEPSSPGPPERTVEEWPYPNYYVFIVDILLEKLFEQTCLTGPHWRRFSCSVRGSQ